MLLELAVGSPGDPAPAVEDDAGGADRALVDGQDHFEIMFALGP
jgi:hypothetical protein